ncbi:MAG: hypothetical protein EZS28_002716 [Streblomastix strix]|uniref:Uncharacterized protein n=1 Tax=Streblomastix strix TaxID=222440 RepID=A0A5J4X5F9_9EUKA|nr:MAG: hypothetical protein EZS28_002716 [Streblomastix strix]
MIKEENGEVVAEEEKWKMESETTERELVVTRAGEWYTVTGSKFHLQDFRFKEQDGHIIVQPFINLKLSKNYYYFANKRLFKINYNSVSGYPKGKLASTRYFCIPSIVQQLNPEMWERVKADFIGQFDEDEKEAEVQSGNYREMEFDNPSKTETTPHKQIRKQSTSDQYLESPEQGWIESDDEKYTLKETKQKTSVSKKSVFERPESPETQQSSQETHRGRPKKSKTATSATIQQVPPELTQVMLALLNKMDEMQSTLKEMNSSIKDIKINNK